MRASSPAVECGEETIWWRWRVFGDGARPPCSASIHHKEQLHCEQYFRISQTKIHRIEQIHLKEYLA
jgi:hypothetical protein